MRGETKNHLEAVENIGFPAQGRAGCLSIAPVINMV